MSAIRKTGASLAVASTLFFVTACGIGGGGDNKDDGSSLGAGEYDVVAKEDVVNSIIVDGTVAPIRQAGISTTLQVPVEKIHVAVGDKVKQGQLLVTMDTSSIERELDAQQQANQQVMSQGEGDAPVQMTAASDLKKIVADAGKTIEDCLKPIIPGGVTVPAPGPAPAPAPAPQGPSREQIEEALNQAHEQGRAQGAQEAQAALQQQAQMPGGEGAGASAGAGAGMSEEEMMAQQQAMAEQQAMAQGGGAGGDTSMLEYQMQEREVTSPINGVVTKIEAEEGSPAGGALMTVADTSRYLVKASVRESDVANMKEGNRVTFTTPITGDRKFEGKVRRVAPMADGAEDGGAAAAARAMQGGGNDSQNSKKDTGISFPVEIEVTGDTKGLRLGGSARVEVITEEDRGQLSIPLDAVYDENKILVLNRANKDATEGTIEERTVKTGVKNDTDIAVTSGELKEGDVVIAWPEDFRDRVGETVTISDENFAPSGADKTSKNDKADKAKDADKSDK